MSLKSTCSAIKPSYPYAHNLLQEDINTKAYSQGSTWSTPCCIIIPHKKHKIILGISWRLGSGGIHKEHDVNILNKNMHSFYAA
jgi:hypothetical protein